MSCCLRIVDNYRFDDRNRLTEVWTLEDTEQALQSSGLSSSTVERRATGGGRRWRMQDRAAVADARRRVLERVPGGMSSVLSRHAVPEFRRQLQERLPRGALRREPAGPGAQAQASGEPEPEPTMQLVAVYLYDAFDRRVVRMVIGVQTWMYAYDRWEEVQELELGFVGSTLSALPVLQSVWGEQLDELVAFRRRSGSAWNERFVAEGGAHCPARVLDAAGNVLEVQEYDPYGSTRFYSGGVFTGYMSLSGNPFHWKGHRFDPETGLVYMRHRHYSPWLGRFVSEDPLGVWGDSMAQGNDYSYAMGRPLTISDPMGLQVTAYMGGAGDQGFPLWTDQIGRARSRHEGHVGDNETFGWSESDKATDWIQEKYKEQEQRLRQQTPIGPLLPIPVVVIGHSWGGAKAKDVSDKLECRGIRVTHLVTLDPVSEGFVAKPTNVDKWVNVHQETGIADYVASVPVLGPVLLVGGPLGLIALWGDSRDESDITATLGGQLGAEDGALNISTDTPHWNATAYLGLEPA